MDPHHRRIELQSPEDFAYLVDNVRRAAAESVQAAFPPVEEPEPAPPKQKGSKFARPKRVDEDDLHTRVEALVTEYIHRTFALAAPNLSINGLPVEPALLEKSQNNNKEDDDEPAEVEEPFDTRKRQRVEDLSREEEDLLRDIALLKRKVPPAAVRAREQALASALAADAAAVAALGEAPVDADFDDPVGGGDDDDTEEAAAAFSSAVAGLGRLKQAMPATVARMERARVAADYAVKER